jgi:hypothetical protein
MGKPRKKVEPAERPWTEASIARLMAYQLMRDGRSVLVVPNCNWTGYECDLLVIEPRNLRVIDVEIKISRADLRADAKKDKWWHSRPWSRRHEQRKPREWPKNAWKHYYVMPREIWDDSLLAGIKESSGILLLDRGMATGYSVRRQPKPNREATPISPADAVDIARLATLRMWSALATKETR